ncbi:TorD/DmsD family molecular chaperone [Arcanobacterium canis]
MNILSSDVSELDAIAAALLVCGRLQIQPADADTRSQVREMIDEWPLRMRDNGQFSQAQGEILASANETDEDIIHDHDTLYGISAGCKVAPFESVHRGQDGLVFDVETLEVRDAYRVLGFEAPALNTEPDDHIGLELDFVARGCHLAIESGDDTPLREVATFSQEHLLRWAPAMLEEARQHACTHWMQGMIGLTIDAVSHWQDYLVEHHLIAGVVQPRDCDV